MGGASGMGGMGGMGLEELLSQVFFGLFRVRGCLSAELYMGVSKNNGTPKSSILIGFSIINHPFWGTPIFGNIHMFLVKFYEIYCS